MTDQLAAPDDAATHLARVREVAATRGHDHPYVSRVFRHDGFDYTVTAVEPTGILEFRRPPWLPQEKGSQATPMRLGRINAAAVREAPEGFLYQPHRVCERRKPRVMLAVASAIAAQGLTMPASAEAVPAFLEAHPEAAAVVASYDALNRAITAHPDYLAGRDDLAEQKMCAAFGMTLPAMPFALTQHRLDRPVVDAADLTAPEG